MTRDEVAQKLYEADYEKLSVFGQDCVDRFMNLDAPKDITKETLQTARLIDEVEILREKVAKLEIERGEQWVANWELEEQIAQLQAEINQPRRSSLSQE